MLEQMIKQSELPTRDSLIYETDPVDVWYNLAQID